jgi:hypothetical protein
LRAWKTAADAFNQQCAEKDLTEAEFTRCEAMEQRIYAAERAVAARPDCPQEFPD